MAVTTQTETMPQAAPAVWRGVPLRLFLTCWLVYLVHFSPFVVRELYLAISLAEKHTVRVDEYADLHSDLFTIPGRGAYLGNNPGTSFLAAVPYWMALPVLNRVAPVRSHPPGEQVSAEYNELRTNKLIWYRKVRERGLDVRLGLAAMLTSGFFMAPLAALSAVVMYRLFARLGFSEKQMMWLALLYGLGTPIFFRAGILSQNLIVALLGVFSLALLWWPNAAQEARWFRSEALRYCVAGALASYAVVTDYTGVITLGMLGLFALAQQMRGKSLAPALRGTLWFVAGAVGPIVLLLYYQWAAFGSPWLPAQFYMPKQVFRGYPSEHGFGWPTPAALWGLLFDPLYGLYVFAPIFALAFYHPVLVRKGQSRVPRNVAIFSWLFFVALYLFSSCIHYTVRHQWQDGVRYIVPALPFLFLLVADVLVNVPRKLAIGAGVLAVAETWCLAMVRENPLESILRVVQHGFQFPWLTTLSKTAAQYYPPLGDEASLASRFLPSAVALAMFAGLWLIWVVRKKKRAV